MRNKNSKKIEDSLLYIKQLVEDYTDLDDISKNTRKREYVYARNVAYKLSYNLLKIPLRVIGEFYNDRDHATVLHGITQFNFLFHKNRFFFYAELYKKLNKHLRKIEDFEVQVADLQNLKDVKKFYGNKYMVILSKTRRLVTKYKKIASKLESEPILREISDLDEKTFNDFKIRAEAFLKMNKQKK